MKILVFGAGAVGSTFGGFLSRDHEVTLLGRPRHLKAICKNGLKISGIWGTHRFTNFRFASRPSQLRGQRFDLALFTVKAYDTFDAARELMTIIKANTPLIALQNGLGNVEKLHRIFPKKQVMAGRVIFGAIIPEPGHVKITVIANPTAIGETSMKKETARVKNIVKQFQAAQLPVVPCTDIESVLWAKVIYNCALNPMASILGCHYGFLMEKEETRLIMDEVISEIYDLAYKMKVKLNPTPAEKYRKLFYSKLVPRTYHHHPSMLQDLRSGKRTEIDALSGEIARLGEKHSVPVPVNALLADMIRRREKR